MNNSFWLDRWQENRIHFHKGEVNPILIKYWDQCELKPGEKVFLPLCGKSLDLAWIAQKGHPAVGAELSPIAVKTFFQENGMTPNIRRTKNFGVWSGQGTEIWCGDFFDLKPQDIPDIGMIFDRAALIALPKDFRQKYAAHLSAFVQSGKKLMLVTLEYLQDEMPGPPFSVEEREVRKLFATDFRINLLEGSEGFHIVPRFKQRGLSFLIEKIYLMEKR